MKILVDTSVWSLSFRKGGPADHPAVQKLRACLLEQTEVVLIGLILQEILQGFRNEVTFQKVSDYLAAFPILKLRRTDFIAAANLHRRCAAGGISISTPDCQIAAAAMNFECSLLTTDQDFRHIARIFPLRLT